MGETVTVLGAGSWGTTIAELAARKGNHVVLWAWPGEPEVAESVNSRHRNVKYLPEFELSPDIVATSDLGEACGASLWVFMAVPSQFVRGLMREAARHLTRSHCVVSATKGLEGPSLTRMTQVVEQEASVGSVAALSGPNLSHEVMRGHPAATVVACDSADVVQQVRHLLGSDRFRVYGSRDRIGVELCGAIKNIYAIGAGMAAGLGFGANTWAFFLTRSAAEMRRLGLHFGAEPETFHGLAGFGDLIATATSPLSRNWRLGHAVVNGQTVEEAMKALGQVAEGVPTLKAVHAYAVANGIDMPQARAIHAVLFEGVKPMEAVRALMLRNVLYEM